MQKKQGRTNITLDEIWSHGYIETKLPHLTCQDCKKEHSLRMYKKTDEDKCISVCYRCGMRTMGKTEEFKELLEANKTTLKEKLAAAKPESFKRMFSRELNLIEQFTK